MTLDGQEKDRRGNPPAFQEGNEFQMWASLLAAALTVPLASQDSSKGTSISCKEMSTEVLTSEPTKPESDGTPPLVRAGLRGFLDLGRFDVIAVIVLVLVAFALRIASPILSDFLSGGGTISALGV